MTPEQINLKLAVFMGTHTVTQEMRQWNIKSFPEEVTVTRDRYGNEHVVWHEQGDNSTFPIGYIFPKRYYEDLNACREVAMELQKRDRLRYVTYGSHLTAVVARYNSVPGGESHMVEDATAPQRCEAALLAIGQWEE